MFVLHTSNRAENLLEHLVKILEAPQRSVLAKEMFLIQSQGMERWLSQQLAERAGLWGNFEYLFPAKFFNNMSEKLDLKLNQQSFSREGLLWQFEALLRDLNDPVFQPLSRYLSGDAVDRKRYQLAQQLTYLFDQYQFMRPDWLAAWEKGERIRLPETNPVIDATQNWQAALWRRLLSQQEAGSEHHGERWLHAIETLKARRHGDLENILPERISVIGINTLSPMYLAYLQALSHHVQVHFYLLNPCQEFWAEGNSEVRQQLREQSLMAEPVNDAEVEPINPLLGMLGQQGRDFQVLLLEQQANEIEISSFDAVASEGTLSLLQQIQNDILYNRGGDDGFLPAPGDRSISIHACHTRMREVEVLKDQLLASFEQDPSLDIRDVVVMAPDIQTYLPYIDAVFADIPYAVADRSLRQSNHLLDILLRFFGLSQSRLLWHEVLDLLDEPAVREQFGLFEADLLLIRHWVDATRIRWGESALHRAELGVGAFSENSWQAGLERLLMGYAVPDDREFCDEVLPFSDLEGSQALALGGFYAYFKLLQQARKQLAQEHTLAQWLEKLQYFATQILLQSQDNDLEWGQLRELFDNLAEVADQHKQPISLVVLMDYLEASASEQKTATGFMRGQLTFCSMLPMRAIPFTVIGLLGMNEGEFPNVDGRAAFDLMDVEFRRGDRSRRADERYQFLEILMSARQQILISYIGQSIKNNDEIPPSVVVSELLDVLAQYYRINSDRVLTRHPLQAFSPRYFLPPESQANALSGQLFSYSAAACELAERLQDPEPVNSGFWWQGELQGRDAPTPKMLIDLPDLFRFYSHPQRYFVEQQLQLRLTQADAIPVPSESFELDNLERFFVNQEWLNRQLSDEACEVGQAFLKRLRAEGRWPHGVLGDQLFESMSEELSGFVSKLKALDLGDKLDAVAVDYQIGDYRLRGSLNCVYQHGNLLYRYARCKAKDQLQAWLNHLIYANAPEHSLTTTSFLHMDGSWQFGAVEAPEQHLLALLDAYRQAQTGLSPILSSAAVAYLERLKKPSSRSTKTPEEMAFEAYLKEIEYDAYYQQLYRNGDAQSLISSPEFGMILDSVFSPMYEARQGISFDSSRVA